MWVRMRNRVVVVKRGAPVWRCEEFFFSRFIIDIIHIIRRYYIIEATRNRTKIHTRFRANWPPPCQSIPISRFQFPATEKPPRPPICSEQKSCSRL